VSFSLASEVHHDYGWPVLTFIATIGRAYICSEDIPKNVDLVALCYDPEERYVLVSECRKALPGIDPDTIFKLISDVITVVRAKMK
jgi:hypothetical protein